MSVGKKCITCAGVGYKINLVQLKKRFDVMKFLADQFLIRILFCFACIEKKVFPFNNKVFI